jgi:hypothetical protein
MTKIIFITSFHGLISRNILATKLSDILAVNNNRIVVLVPDFKKSFFEREFSSKNVIIEGIKNNLSKKDFFFHQLALALLPTRTMRIKKRSDFYHNKKLFNFLLSVLPAYLFGWCSYCLDLVRFLDYFFCQPTIYKNLFDKYNPALIFSTDIQNELDVRLLQEARKRKIKTIGMIRSWDNPTAKGILRIIPDAIVAANKIIKSELIKYSCISGDEIFVVGIPHYDNYLISSSESKSDFFKKFSFDSNKKLILFTPTGDRYIENNDVDQYVLEILSQLDANILVRFPPADIVSLKELKNVPAKIFFQYTGTRSWKEKFGAEGAKVNEVSRDDDKTLIAALLYSDVVVTGPSTLCIDAAFFDKPIILIGFDGYNPRPYFKSIRRYYDYEHFQPIFKSGGVKFAHNQQEFSHFIKEYLQNPKLDQSGREKIVEDECWKKDGKATERLASTLFSALE